MRTWIVSTLRPALLALGAVALVGCASVPNDRALPQPVQLALQKAGLPTLALGLVAFPLDRSKPPLRWHASEPKAPASSIKLVPTVVALELLGTNTRGRTDLLINPPVSGDTVTGPLYLRGGADTDLDWGSLWSMLRQLREQGIRHIKGGLVVDRTLFQPPRLDIGVAQFDDAPERQYNVIPDALFLNGGMMRFYLQSDAQTFSARADYKVQSLTIDTSAMVLTNLPCADWRDSSLEPEIRQDVSGTTVVLRGAFPVHCRQDTELNVVDRQQLTAHVVRSMWLQLGGEMDGTDLEGATPAQATIVATHYGNPFAEVARGMIKTSDNPLTRLTYLRLGAKFAKTDEPTLAAADRVVREWFATKGIPTQGLVLDNGSGLSRSERISPNQLAAVLVAATKGLYLPELLTTMPVAGRDGTLTRRLKGIATQDRARLKTGTLRNADALAGFVQDANHRTWVVVGLVNHEDLAGRGRPVLDSVIEWVAGQQ